MVYVDEPRTFSLKFPDYCHIWSDGSDDELHAFADSIGLQRSWFQNREGFHHYDLSLRKRKMVLSKGATFMPLADWIKHKGGIT
jgi:hypothetical protein